MGNLLWLAFSGGEIFLRKDLVEITKVFYDTNKPAIILLPSNGLTPSRVERMIEEILAYCRNSTIVVKLSIDGPEDVHDSLRGVKGSFKKSIQTYSLLTELQRKYKNFDLGINTVFCAANQDHIEGTIEFVKNLNGLNGLNNHTVSLIRGNVSNESMKEVDEAKYYSIIEKMAADLRERSTGKYRFMGAKLKAAQDILQRRFIHETSLKKKMPGKCYAGVLSVVLTEKGDVYPCESLDMKMGNVRENGYDINGMLKTDQGRKVIDFIKGNGCYCTHECNFIINILFNPLLYPSLAKEYLRL